jgi:16S rRNA (adenine1518-N6/adenine1519-N6)-dimethyltransferase
LRRARKSLGQNFLVDGNLQRKVVAALEAGSDDEVLEIGPGRGALTSHLAGRVGRLILVELDRELAADLEVRYGGRAHVEVLQSDILQVRLDRLSRSPGRLLVVGNIPYNITTPLLFHLLERPRPARLLLMIQKEVGERILAPPGTAEYGALAVGVRTVARVERVLDVPRTVFRPVPGVDSVVVRITPFDPPPLGPEQEAELRVLTRAAFQWRRKQLQKTLRDHPDLSVPRAAVAALEAESGLDLMRRPESLSPDDFVRLSALVAPLRTSS